MQIQFVSMEPFQDQRPGTAGLRKTVATVRQPGYLASFLQSVFDVAALPADAPLVVGGDGRYYNREAIQILIAVAAANGVRHLIVGRGGLLSTPAASHLIRKRQACGGFILTASHNPGGIDGDFGIKFNIATGAQASETLTEAIFQRSKQLPGYRILADLPTVDLERLGSTQYPGCSVEIVDPVDDYAALMERLFDFDRITDALRGGLSVCFDAMHAVTGPYARRILVDRLGLPPASLRHAEPLADFGGLHPDPNPQDAADLVRYMAGPGAPDLAAASDGDGDRNMILGPGFFVHPCDSLAILAAGHRHIPGYRDGLAGVARSMPTSRAIDQVAAALQIPCHVTPTGWRFFCNLLEAGEATLCGEESFGTSSNHAREKDGLWAVLYWLNLLAATGLSVETQVRNHWRRFGRHYYLRQDYAIPHATHANALLSELRERCQRGVWPDTAGTVLEARDFEYLDPVDGSRSTQQGIELLLPDAQRVVYRLSGTGTSGSMLRVYLERHVATDGVLDLPAADALAPLSAVAARLAGIERHTGLRRPTQQV